jgi:hypothetical protein
MHLNRPILYIGLIVKYKTILILKSKNLTCGLCSELIIKSKNLTCGLCSELIIKSKSFFVFLSLFILFFSLTLIFSLALYFVIFFSHSLFLAVANAVGTNPKNPVVILVYYAPAGRYIIYN